jgi:hypothetical protein
METAVQNEFERLYCGRLWAVMSWNHLSALWDRIDPAAGWYLYAVGEPAPTLPSAEDETREFVRRIDELLRKEHHEDYCGIVYADDLQAPRMIKIYDPNHLGSSCGSSKHPPPPGWVMSRVVPVDVQHSGFVPAGRKRWWQAFLGQ